MIPRAEGPFLDTHYYYGSEWYDKRPFGYNWFPHHRAPIPRRYLMVPDEDDLSNIVWKEDNETNTNKEFEANTKDIFLYLFETKKMYKFIGDKEKSVSFKKDKLLILGDDELVIYNEYWTKGGYINYPFKSFDLNDVNVNALIGNNGEFYIKYLEIFSFEDF